MRRRRRNPRSRASLLGRFVLAGFTGWAIENVLNEPGAPTRYSWLFGGLPVPLLPIFGVGGVIVSELAPRIERLPIAQRAAAYAVLTTGLEFAAGNAERRLGHESWAYGEKGSTIDVPHTLAWTGLALVVEAIVTSRTVT